MSVQKARVIINPGDSVGRINPNIYGHFAEHLGRCIYDGIWVGEDSPIPNIGGFRTDVIEALRKMKPPVIRWPGGCFADDYHWQDGIGPRESRPRRINIHWGEVIETNHVGTQEFVEVLPPGGGGALFLRQRGLGHGARAARLGGVLQLSRRQQLGQTTRRRRQP